MLELEGLHIEGDLIIRNCQLTSPVSWPRLVVAGETRLESCVFQGAVHLEETVFRGNVYVTNCEFLDDAHFGGSKFEAHATILECTFHRYASFRDCMYCNYYWELKTEFFGHYNRSRAQHLRESFINECRFHRVNTFDNVKFARLLSLRGCVFYRAPTFFGATLSEEIDTREAKFPDIWSTDAYEAYRTIRRLFSDRQVRTREALFYRLEQKALTYRERMGAERALALIYEKLSEYGTSIARVVTSMVVLNIAFYAYYYFTFRTASRALEFGSMQIFVPFHVWRATTLSDPAVSLETKLVASLHSVTVVILLGFLLLALRWRFRSE